MTSLKIILDTSLDNKDIKYFLTLQQQKELDLLNPDCCYSEYEYNSNLIDKGQTTNNFINAFLHAYNQHKTIKIRPDDIKLQILNIISICVNNNPEDFRHFFVEHQGKKDIIVKLIEYNSNIMCHIFGKLLEENIKVPEFAQKYKSTFSTTTQVISNVNILTLMNTLKEYFNFTLILSCGIPSVLLMGTQTDWIKLKEDYEYFKSIFSNSELKNWFTHFDIIMDLFITMRNLQPYGEVNGTQYIKDIWKRVISYVPYGSGGDKLLGGWVRLFVPYTSKNKLIEGLDKNILCLDLNLNEPKLNYDCYEWQDRMKRFYLASGWGEMISSYVTTPIKIIDLEVPEPYECEFYSGFFEAKYDNDNDCISMNIGYIIRENQQIKKNKQKEDYISKGVIEKQKGSLDIPKILQKEANKILDIFDSYGYSFYGIDPVQEERKKWYLENGVKIKLSPAGYERVYIPEKFRENKKDIEETFEVYIIYFLNE